MMRPVSAVAFLLLGLAGNSSDAPTTRAVSPPKVTVLQNGPSQADGLIFIAPKGAGIGGGPRRGRLAPETIDNNGGVSCYPPLQTVQGAADSRFHSFGGRPVL